MAQTQAYIKLRTEPNGDVILERKYTDEVKKEDILERLNDELVTEQKNLNRINKHITRLQNRIAAITAL